MFYLVLPFQVKKTLYQMEDFKVVWETQRFGLKAVFNTINPNPNHKYFRVSGKHLKGMVPMASLLLIEGYIKGKKQSKNKWLQDKSTYIVKYEDINKQKVESKPLNYTLISNYIRRRMFFSNEEFNVFALKEYWMDCQVNHCSSIHMSQNGKSLFHFSEHHLESGFGNSFPLKPSIDREGYVISSFLEPLLDRIARKRIELVATSDKALNLDWFFNFKDLINDTISSIDIVLNLIYLKAKYDPLPGWKFDVEKLGSRYGQRLRDKLKWIYKISGNTLDIEAEKKSLILLREVRNHLNHYDPPCISLSLEEICHIINSINDIGVIHLKIRKAMKIQASQMLINFILLPEIIFVPESHSIQRAKMDTSKEGYQTSKW